MLKINLKDKSNKSPEKGKNEFKDKPPTVSQILLIGAVAPLAAILLGSFSGIFYTYFYPDDRKLASCNLAGKTPECVFFEENFSHEYDDERILAIMDRFSPDLNRDNPRFMETITDTEFRVSRNNKSVAAYRDYYRRVTLRSDVIPNDYLFHNPNAKENKVFDNAVRRALGHESLHVSYRRYLNYKQKLELGSIFTKAVRMLQLDYRTLLQKCSQHGLSSLNCDELRYFCIEVDKRYSRELGDISEVFAYGLGDSIPDFLLPYYTASLRMESITLHSKIFRTGLTVEEFLNF